MEKCLLCGLSQINCNCKGGFKIIYVFGVPISKEELDLHNSKPEIEKKILSANFIAHKIKEVNEKITEDISSVSSTIKDIDTLSQSMGTEVTKVCKK